MDPDQTTSTPTTQVPTFDPTSDPEYQAANKVVTNWLSQDPDNPSIGTRQVSDALKVIATKTKGAPHTVIHGDQAITIDPLTGKVINTQAIPGGATGKTDAERTAYVNAENARAAQEAASTRRSDAETGAIETPQQRADRETNLENLRQSGDSARNAASIQGTHENVATQEAGANQRNAATEAGATQRTVLQGQNSLQQIEAKRQSDIELARQKFDQDKDLTALQASLKQINDTALETLKGEQARQTQQQTQDFERPFRQATSAAETQNAATNQRRAEQDAAYQNATLDQGARRDAAKPLTDLAQSNSTMLSKMAEAGTAPVAGAGALVFSPLQMAYSLMRQGVRDGTIDPGHVPDYGAPTPQDQGSSSTPDLTNAPAPQSLGPMTPEAEPGYQPPTAAPEPTTDKPDDDEEGG